MYVPITKYPWGGSFCPEAFAEAKLMGSGLKFRLWCCEKHPRVTMTKPNSMVCLDSCLEVFLNPYPDFTRDYLNFEMNAAGTLLLQKGPDRAHRSFVNLAVPHYPQVHAWQLPDVWGVELEVLHKGYRGWQREGLISCMYPLPNTPGAAAFAPKPLPKQS